MKKIKKKIQKINMIYLVVKYIQTLKFKQMFKSTSVSDVVTSTKNLNTGVRFELSIKIEKMLFDSFTKIIITSHS